MQFLGSSVLVAPGLSCSGLRRIFLDRIKSVSAALGGGFFATELPGKPLSSLYVPGVLPGCGPQSRMWLSDLARTLCQESPKWTVFHNQLWNYGLNIWSIYENTVVRGIKFFFFLNYSLNCFLQDQFLYLSCGLFWHIFFKCLGSLVICL